jgi:hypothetical protein
MRRDIVSDLSRQLPLWRRRAIARELRSHLRDAQHDLETAGWAPEEAVDESIRRFGSVDDVAEGFDRVYRPARAKRFAVALGLAGALLAGAWGGGTFASATSAHRAPSGGTKTSFVRHAAVQTHTCHHQR